jgi:hypothetical protein
MGRVESQKGASSSQMDLRNLSAQGVEQTEFEPENFVGVP